MLWTYLEGDIVIILARFECSYENTILEELSFEFIRCLHLLLGKYKVLYADVNKGICKHETITLTPAISSFHNRTQQ